MPRTKSDTFNRKVKFYDENFDLKETPVTGKLPEYKTYQEAFNAIGSEENVLNALNSYLRAKTIQDAISQVSGGMEERYIMAFIKPFRLSDEFKDIEKDSEQTAAILAKVKTIPFLMDQLKSYCKNKAAEEAAGESEE